MGKTYILTGGAGFLGQRIVETLCTNNVDDVTTLKVLDLHFNDELREEQTKTCKEANIYIEWIEADITDYNKVLSAVNGSDVVIHTASVIDVYEKIPFKTKWDINVGGTVNLLRACSEANVKYFIYTSSMNVVGPNLALDPLVDGNEESEYISDTTDAYPLTKREAEKKVLEANGTKTADGNLLVTCSLRPTGMFGEWNPIMKSFIEQVPNKKMYALSKSTDHITSVYVGNAAWCHILTAQKKQFKPELIGGNTYYLGDGSPTASCSRFLLELCEHRGFYIPKPEPILPYWLTMLLSVIISTILNFLPKIVLKFLHPYLQNFPKPFIIRSISTNFTVSHAKFQKHFDYVPLYSWEEARDRTRKHIDLLLDQRDKKTN